MIALLVKPVAWKRAKFRRVLDGLVQGGAYVLQSHTARDIAQEVTQLLNQYGDVTVVACGGDGTAHLLANGVYGLDVTFAVIPMGTGNDFARYLGITDLDTALDTLHGSEFMGIDVGTVSLDDGTTRHFIGVTSCGFDAQVNERANTYRGPQGTAKYVAALLGELKSLKPLTIAVDVDGVSEVRTVILMAIGNTNSYGGGMRVCPQASALDGVFTVTSVEVVSRSLLLRVFPKVFTGSHIHHPKVSTFDAKTIRISGTAFPMYADGERIGMGPATIAISPQALLVKVKSPQ